MIFFGSVIEWAKINEKLIDVAFERGKSKGLSAMDALHIASAEQLNAQEFFTLEGKSKPFFNVQTHVSVIPI